MIRIVLAIVFLSSGLSKLIDPTSFSVIIEAYGLIPESWVMPVAIALPLLEVVGSLGLLLDIRGSLATISGMLVLFLVILGYGVWMGLDIDCGCFGYLGGVRVIDVRVARRCDLRPRRSENLNRRAVIQRQHLVDASLMPP